MMRSFQKMIRSLLGDYIDTETTSWASHFDFLEKVLIIPGCTVIQKCGNDNYLKLIRVLVFLVMCSTPIFSLYSVLTISSNSQLRFDSILSFAIGMHIFTKYIFLCLFKTNRAKLSEYVKNATSVPHDGNKHCQEVGKRYRIFTIQIMGTTVILYIMTATVYNILPLFASDPWKLPLQSPIIGISFHHHPGYEINYLFIIFQVIIPVAATIVFDSLFLLFCSFTVSSFELCAKFCIHIGDKTGDYNTEEKQKELLKYLVEMHSEAVKFFNECKEIFEIFILGNISTFMGICCVCIVQIVSENRLEAYFGLTVGGTQLLLYSILGQMIISKREDLVTAIYCSDWYKLKDVSNKKTVYLMLLNAQRCEGIRIIGFTELSLEAYCSMMKACYSFTAFLMNII